MKKFKLLLVSLVLMAFGATGVYAEDYAATHTSNVTFTLGNKSYKEKMNIAGTSYDVVKLGTSSVVGTASFKIPAGTAKIHMHVIGWKGKSSQVNLTANNGVTLGTTAITPKSDDGATSNSPYTLKGDATTYYYEITTTGVEQETTITMTTVSGKTRVIVWGVNTEVATVVDPETPEYTITANVNDPAMGIVSGAGKYYEGTVASLNAIPNSGYQFVNWSNGSTDNPLKITVTEDVEITANFEVIPPMTCAEAAAAANGATVVLNPFDVVAVVKGAGYIYIKDESGVNLIYDFNLDDQLKAGDHVEGFVGVSSPYYGLPELKPSVAFADLTVTHGTAPEPTLFTAVPTKADVNKYIKFENVTLTANTTFSTGSATNATMVVNGTNVTLRNNFKLAATLSKDKAYNIVGFAAIYNSTIQVYFLSAEEYVAPEPCTLATPVNWDAPIAAEANTDQWYAVNVASAIAAGKDLALTVTNPGTEAVDITIEAYADCPATELIVKSTKTFNAGETKTTTVKYDEYLADQVEVVYLHVVTSGDLTIGTEAIEPCSKATPINWDEAINAEANSDKWYAVNIASAKEAAKDLELTVSNPGEEAVKVTVEVYADCPATELIAESTATINAGASKTKTVGYFDIFADLVDVIYFHVITEGGEIKVEAETAKFNVTATAENGTVEGVGVYEQGTEATLTATPAEGYEFVNWTSGETVVSTENPYKFTVTADVALVANFKKAAPAMETVYFVNAQGWTGTIKAYAWEPVQNAAWPGAAATKEAEQIGGYDVYSYTAEAGKYANVIFNGTGGQTADLKWTAGKYYVLDGWYTKEEAEAKLATPIVDEVVYFVNNKKWSKVNAYAWEPANAAWPGKAATKEAEQIGGFDVYSYSAAPGTYQKVIFNDGGSNQTADMVWTAGKYIVNNKWYTKEEAEAALAAPVVTTWTMVGDKALFGTDWDLNATANDLVKQEDGSWVLTLTNKTLAAKSYEYKAAKDRSWTTTVPGGNNAKLTISKAGQYDVTFTLNAAATSVTAKATYIPAKYNVTVTTENGTVTGAGEYEEGATATLTATAAEGYEFVNWTVGEEVVSTENPYSFVVTADVALVANFEKAKPEVITYELNGGEFPAVVVPTNAELWETFKPYYNTYYGLARADQPIDKVSTFANAKMQEIMTDEASEYKWLGDYVQSVATAAGVPLSTDMASANEGGWRWAVHAFFNAAAGQYGAAGIDFTEAGKQEVWGAAYEAEYGVVLPTEPVAEDYVLPTPTKEGYTFVGWYDNAEGTGEAYTVIPAGWAGTLYAIWEAEAPAVEYTEIVMSNLVVTPYGEYDILEASDAMTGIAVMLGVDADGKLVEGSEVTWNGTSMTILSSDVFTKAYNDELATDVYNGKLVIEFYGEEMGLDLYMYGTGAASSVDVVVTNAKITVDEWGSYVVTAEWGEGTLTCEVSDTEYEGFMMIEYTITEDDWYIWMAYSATVTTTGNVMTIEGEFTDNYTGTTYNVTISGTLTPTGVEDATVTVKPVKMIKNGQLIIGKDGVQYNANGAIIK